MLPSSRPWAPPGPRRPLQSPAAAGKGAATRGRVAGPAWCHLVRAGLLGSSQEAAPLQPAGPHPCVITLGWCGGGAGAGGQ